MIVAIFRARIREDRAEEYYRKADEMAQITTGMPGFISYKAYTAPDGERVSIEPVASSSMDRGIDNEERILKVEPHVLAALVLAVASAACMAIHDRHRSAGYVLVNVVMYYERAGGGPPLVLHGAAMVAEGWNPQVEEGPERRSRWARPVWPSLPAGPCRVNLFVLRPPSRELQAEVNLPRRSEDVHNEIQAAGSSETRPVRWSGEGPRS